MYYGSVTSKIFNAETGYTDNGQPINFKSRGAFSFFESRGNYKAFKDIRPLLKTTRGISLGVALDLNFSVSPPVNSISTGNGIFTPWGSLWGSPWSSGEEYLFDRFATKGQGHSAAVRFEGSVGNSECQFYGFEIRFDQGGQV